MTQSIDLGGQRVRASDAYMGVQQLPQAAVAFGELLDGAAHRAVPLGSDMSKENAYFLTEDPEAVIGLQDVFFAYTVNQPGEVRVHNSCGASFILDENEPLPVAEGYLDQLGELTHPGAVLDERPLRLLDQAGLRLITAVATLSFGKTKFDVLYVPKAWGRLVTPEDVWAEDYPVTLAASLASAGLRRFTGEQGRKAA